MDFFFYLVPILSWQARPTLFFFNPSCCGIEGMTQSWHLSIDAVKASFANRTPHLGEKKMFIFILPFLSAKLYFFPFLQYVLFSTCGFISYFLAVTQFVLKDECVCLVKCKTTTYVCCTWFICMCWSLSIQTAIISSYQCETGYFIFG